MRGHVAKIKNECMAIYGMSFILFFGCVNEFDPNYKSDRNPFVLDSLGVGINKEYGIKFT